MKVPQLLAFVLSCTTVGYSRAMQQIELDNPEPLQTLSTFDGYQFGHNFSPDGIYSFHYSLPTSSRKEQRTASGEVTGEYAFVAPEGDEFEFRYNAGNEGFRVESNALPVAPEDTDEVKKAKEEFFAAFQKALELAGSEEEEEDSDESESSEEDYSSEESDEDSSSSSEEDSDEDSEEEEEEGEEEEAEAAESIQRQTAVIYRPRYDRPQYLTGFGERIQRAYPYPYSR